MPDPRLFVSHKHADVGIARVIASFVEAKSSSQVKVFLSSDPAFQGPKYGQGLNSQLRATLWESDVLLLIYTSADQDWSYCMWECGVATHPQSPNTNIIVFQCGAEAPAPFAADLRVNARKQEDIKRFTGQFLRDPKFFPSLDRAVVGPAFRDQYVEEAAEELFVKLGNVLPVIDEGSGDEWRAWPYLRIELPRSEVDKLEQASERERVAISIQVVKSQGIVVDCDSRASQLFGLTSFPKRSRFDSLLKAWQSAYPDLAPAWFDSCCEQISIGAGRGFPIIRQAPLREVGAGDEFTPVLTRIRRAPFAGCVHFDLYFYNLADPRAVPVTSKMISLEESFHKKLGKVDPGSLKLLAILEELDQRGLNRVPFLNDAWHPMYIVHRSMIEKFIVSQLRSSAGARSLENLTLADLLADPELSRMFEDTFVVVRRLSTLAEAKSAMLTRPGCSDVFVTAGGGRKEPVEGWLTNVDIARSS